MDNQVNIDGKRQTVPPKNGQKLPDVSVYNTGDNYFAGSL